MIAAGGAVAVAVAVVEQPRHLECANSRCKRLAGGRALAQQALSSLRGLKLRAHVCGHLTHARCGALSRRVLGRHTVIDDVHGRRFGSAADSGSRVPYRLAQVTRRCAFAVRSPGARCAARRAARRTARRVALSGGSLLMHARRPRAVKQRVVLGGGGRRACICGRVEHLLRAVRQHAVQLLH